MDKKALGRRINASRKGRNLTGDALAEECSINATYLRQIESGLKLPSLPMFVLLCDKLKVSPSYLLQDQFSDAPMKEMDIISELWNRATPDQIKLISAMLQSAIKAISDDQS